MKSKTHESTGLPGPLFYSAASTESGIIFLRFSTRAKIKKETKLSLQEKPINLG